MPFPQIAGAPSAMTSAEGLSSWSVGRDAYANHDRPPHHSNKLPSLLLADEGAAQASGGGATYFSRRSAPLASPFPLTDPANRPAQPQLRPSTRPEIEGQQAVPFNWSALVDQSIHEQKIAIAEALEWIGAPLSAIELWFILDLTTRQEYATLAYHARSLQKLGLTVEAGFRETRGATEIYYLPAS